jgi:S1-C subfamily serine protease
MTATILNFERPLQDALFAVRAIVPDSAITADLLGTERHSHAVQVTPQGLLLTVGYSIMEASEIWLTNRRGQTAAAIVLANDYDSGLALLRPTVPLGSFHLETAGVAELNEGDTLQVLASEDRDAHPVTLAAIQEFAGRWEYLLEKALYTVPLFERWSGAALLTADGRLCGIGSLALGIRAPGKQDMEAGNLFVPVDLVMPHLDYMTQHGQRPGQLRPWLGALVEDHDDTVCVVGIYHNAPAANAGLQPGDVILAVDRQPVSTMAGFFRTLWHYGPAGTAVPLTVSNGKDTREVLLDTTDRESFFLRHMANMLN